ncbi:alpha/beta hydrolase [Candidatus Acetothermia bacterium]|nr:alpha/beta hydrolase [Candidatus Acetothermia bacterium]
MPNKPATTQAPKEVWQGALEISGFKARLVLRIWEATDGTLTGNLESVDQGGKNTPADNLTFQGGVLRFGIKTGQGQYEGTVKEDGSEISGTWTQFGRSFPLVFHKSDNTAGLPDSKQSPESKKAPTQVWQGALVAGGSKLRLVLKIWEATDSTLTAKVDSPDQGAMDLPVDTISFKEKKLSFEMNMLGASYEGVLNESGTEISGTFKQRGASFPLVLKKSDQAALAEVKHPQEPKKPYPYKEEEIVFANAKAGVKLAGTLTMPKSGSPFPAVVLITGSGPQNRDEELLGHKPFLVLADYLTRRGIAVLRFDDRGVGKSTGDFSKATSADFATDALAAVEYLKTRKEINLKQIGLIGHSEGGLIAPMVAVQSPDVAFIVLMAGPGVPGDEILYLQEALISKVMGRNEEEIAKNREVQKRMYAVVKEEKDQVAAEQKLREILKDASAKMSASEDAINAQIEQSLSPWFRYFLNYDPRPTLQKVKCPVLAINGEKDLQVPPQQNLPEIEKALKAGGNSDYSIVKLPSLNHLFQTSKTGAPSEYAQIEETIAPVALETMGNWILQHTQKY